MTKSMKVQIAIHDDTWPELFEDIENIPIKRRAERLRSLAVRGLMAIQAGTPIGGHLPVMVATQPQIPAAPAVDESTKREEEALARQKEAEAQREMEEAEAQKEAEESKKKRNSIKKSLSIDL